MSIFYLLLIISISAAENTSIIYIHEELPSNILLYSSISSSNVWQWLPSSYPFQSYFSITPNQSLYTTNQTIDREEFCERKLCNCSQCLINLNFLQTFSTNNISIRTIQVIIEDINDHSPTFKQTMIKLPIAENVPIGYEIPLEPAIDNDYGLLSIQSYELYPTINNPFRLLKNSKPILKLEQILDREIKSNYLLKLIAYDGGQPALSGEQIIEIIITDVNDNAPAFDQLIYRKSLPESQSIDSLIIKIHAMDPDEGENARIDYSIDDPSSTFNINHQTGEIFLKKSLDYEKVRSYSITIKAHDNGVPQLNNYATLIIDVTDVNDHTPNVLLTQVNGTIMNNRLINLPECSSKGTPLLYIYVTDEDSDENGRVSCTLNDTRLALIYLTTNAYSLQINDSSSSFDYEIEQSVVVHLQCQDHGLVSLSTSTLIYIQIEDCNDNPPEIIYPLPFNQSLLIPYETTVTPFIITQFIVDDRDRFQGNRFFYSFIVYPYLDLSLSDNGTLILQSMPLTIGNDHYQINVTIADQGNLTSKISIPIYIHSINETRNFSIENTSLTLCLIFFILIFLSAIFISVCYLITFILRRNLQSNSSSQSTTSSNEQAGSSQKTTIEVLDENSSNHIGVINTSGIHQSDFDYSEKVQRYLTHLNNHNIDEEDRLRRFEQLYAIIERHNVSSNSLYV